MKVLWFTSTPANGIKFLNEKLLNAGWLQSLDKVLQNKLDLHIAFHYPKLSEPFYFGKTNYYPIADRIWKINAIKNIFFPQVTDEEDLNRYLNIVKIVKPDLIHIHGTENPYGAIIPHVVTPCVVSIQGNITVYHHKFFSGIEKQYARVRSTGNGLKDFIFSESFIRKYRLFEKMKSRELKNLRNTRYVIGRTDWDKRITSVMAPSAVYFKGEEALREDFYNQKWIPKKNDGRVIIHSTNGDRLFKGFETICQTINELEKLSINVCWRVAGISEKDAVVKAAKKKLRKYYPERGLLLLGKLGPEDLVKRLQEADIYVMPSHIENSPNNLCEAMILGMPCIATFSGGTGSILQDGKEGILIQDGDPWAMSGAILELVNDPEKALRLGRAARTRALNRHDPDQIVNSLLETYRQIIQMDSATSPKFISERTIPPA